MRERVETFGPDRSAFKPRSVPIQGGLEQHTSLSLSFPSVNGDTSANSQSCCAQQWCV